MDDPKVIAGKYAKEVNEAIDEASKVATDAYDKINAEPPAYETKDAIKTFFDFTRIAIRSAADIARIPLQTKPDPRVLLLADHVSTVVRRGLLEATQVASEAADVIDKDPMSPDRDELVKSAVKIARIGMLRSAEIAQTIAAGPGAYADPVLPSDDITIAPVNYDRTLKVDTLGRKGVKEDVAKLVISTYRTAFCWRAWALSDWSPTPRAFRAGSTSERSRRTSLTTPRRKRQ